MENFVPKNCKVSFFVHYIIDGLLCLNQYVSDSFYSFDQVVQQQQFSTVFITSVFAAYWMKARLNMLLGNTEDAIASFERVG